MQENLRSAETLDTTGRHLELPGMTSVAKGIIAYVEEKRHMKDDQCRG